jgi:hypothetical protein
MNWSAPESGAKDPKDVAASIVEWIFIAFATVITTIVGYHCNYSNHPWMIASAVGITTFLFLWYLIKRFCRRFCR